MTLNDVEALEQARCAAMIGADATALESLLSSELRWTHASGKVDTKESMISQFGDGSMRVFSLERSETEARVFGSAAIVTGVVRMDAMAGGVRKDVHSRYSGVWSAHHGAPQLVNWQSARQG